MNPPNTKAGEAILARARNLQFHRSCTWNEALQLARDTSPELVKALGIPDSVQIANDAASNTSLAGRPARARAAQQFREEVHAHMNATGETYDAAWKSCLKSKVELANDAGLNLPPGPASIVKRLQAQSTEAGTGITNRLALALPGNATEDEYQVAFKANGSQLTSRDPEAIFNALAADYAKREGVNLAVGKLYCLGRYQALSSEISPASKSEIKRSLNSSSTN
ncbi:MAG: hypothetical protein JWR69_2661 [Pedosphaera sp.]|nr:hypothetical protein [Pedosphaera sp.]